MPAADENEEFEFRLRAEQEGGSAAPAAKAPEQPLSSSPLAWAKGAAQAAGSLAWGVPQTVINEGIASGIDMLHNAPSDPSGNEFIREGRGLPGYTPGSPEGRAILGGLQKVTKPLADLIEKGADTDNPDPRKQATGHLIKALLPLAPMKAVKVEREAVPELSAMKAGANALYDTAKSTGEVAWHKDFGPMIQDAETKLRDRGYRDDANPMAAKALAMLEEEATNPKAIGTSALGMQRLRESLRNYEASAFNPGQPKNLDSSMVSDIIDSFDSMVDANMPGTGAAQAAAREAWRKYRNSESLKGVMERAQVRSDQFKQAGMENALRTEFAQLYRNPKRMRFFNDEETAAIRDVANGTATQKTLRRIGALFSPTGHGGLAIDSIVGAFAGLPVGAALAGAGAASKFAAGKLRESAARTAVDTAKLGRRPRSRTSVQALPATGSLPIAEIANSDQGRPTLGDWSP
jgi:hypothetical protein